MLYDFFRDDERIRMQFSEQIQSTDVNEIDKDVRVGHRQLPRPRQPGAAGCSGELLKDDVVKASRYFGPAHKVTAFGVATNVTRREYRMRRLVSIVEKKTVVRARDLYRSGIHPEALSLALQRGLRLKIGRGLSTGFPVTSNTVKLAAK